MKFYSDKTPNWVASRKPVGSELGSLSDGIGRTRPTTPDAVLHAAKYVCERAHDARDATDLLDKLGLLDQLATSE